LISQKNYDCYVNKKGDTHTFSLLFLQNNELKDVIKKMLEDANLEQVTMKTVLKDVSM